MKIKDLLQDISVEVKDRGVFERDLIDISCRSGDIRPGALFVAIQGEDRDGHRFVLDALEKGAVACVVDARSHFKFPESFPLIKVKNTRFIFSLLSSRFFSNPSMELGVVGVTGTNGKTTISFLIQHIFNHFSSCGLIGTIHHQIGSQIIPSKNTTPSAYDLNWMFTQMQKVGMEFCSMEVSSHALVQERVAHVYFRSAVFTNLTQDHLDYHETLEQYFEAKRKLFFKTPRPAQIFINADDLYGERLSGLLAPKPFTFGILKRADFLAQNIRVGLEGVQFEIKIGKTSVPIEVELPCLHNVYNILGAFACAFEEGWDPFEISEALKSFPGVPGRMEKVDRGQNFFVFVDYAHTPDAFQNVLSSVRGLAKKRIITVFGCGGDRDLTKRPLMGRSASFFSDVVILTSDNPRSEDPEAILNQVEEGVVKGVGKDIFRISNREEAIAQALSLAKEEDVVLVLGKGHENCQIVGNQRFAFDDRLCVEKILTGASRVEAV